MFRVRVGVTDQQLEMIFRATLADLKTLMSDRGKLRFEHCFVYIASMYMLFYGVVVDS